MKKETILDLYYGRLNPIDEKIMEEEEYKKHVRAHREASDKFREKLPAGLAEEFEQICEDEMKADEILLRDAFYKGFRTGLRLTAEAFMQEE